MAEIKQAVYAIILIIVVIFNNAPALAGIKERIAPRYILARMAEKRRKPEDISDDKAEWSNVPTKISMDEVLSVDMQQGKEYVPDKPKKEKGGK